MKSLLVIMMLAFSFGSYGKTLTEGPRVVGNGGGGVKKNGVYKTFYSAGVYVSEELDEVPGGELFTSTILSLIGEGSSTNTLLAAGLPFGNRKFYKISESQMDDTTMGRLIEEYARIVQQPAEGLTIFAITDIEKKSTYLLPSFFKLNEVEQAAILFHEAYWILNTNADYSEVIAAEMAFQKYVEAQVSGKYEVKLPRLLGKLLRDPSLPIKTALEFDKVSQSASDVVNVDGKVKLKYLFVNKQGCTISDTTTTGKNMFGRDTKIAANLIWCETGKNDVRLALENSRKHPSSYFLAELVNYLTSGNRIKSEYYSVFDIKKDAVSAYLALEVKADHISYYSVSDILLVSTKE